MIDLDAFKTPSLTKKIVFSLLSFFSGIAGLLFFPEIFWIKGILILISISSALVASMFLQRKYLILILPLFFWGAGIFLNISDNESMGFSFFALGILFAGLSFSQSYQEKIELSFFRDSFRAYTRGGIFLLLGILLTFGMGNSDFSGSSSEADESDLFSFDISEFSDPLIAEMIEKNFSAENTQAFYAQCNNFPSAQKNICREKIDTKISEEKQKMHQEISDQLDENIEKYTSPDALKTLAEEKNIPYLSEINPENFQIIFLLIFAFFIFLPLVPLFGLLGGLFSSLLFSLLVFSGLITLGKKEVKKEIIY